MTNRSQGEMGRAQPTHGSWLLGSAGLVLGAMALLSLGGCKKAPPPPPPPPPPVIRQPDPEPLDVASLVQSMGVDARVEFAPSQAPVDRSLAEAAVHLADAFAKGDSDGLRKLLDKRDQPILDQLVTNEQWLDATDKIEAVRVVSIDSGSRLSEAPERTELALAVQDPDGAYVLVWSGKKLFDNWVFTAKPASGEERARAAAWDGLSPTALEDGGAGGVSAFAGVDPAVLAQLAQFGLDPTNPDPQRLQAFLDQFGEKLPPDVREKLRAILEALGGGGRDAGGGDEGGPPPAEESAEPGQRKKNTPAGPVTIPGGG
ncbi:MAG: hypothetical protein IPJ41_16735 [Phycisphaerales bacterium]|nr:hypothetical protein [Phycisphaerales bacterium]